MFGDHTVIKDGVIQPEKVGLDEVFKAIKAAGITNVNRIADILSGHPIMVSEAYGFCLVSYLDHIMMQQRRRDIHEVEYMTKEELAHKPWLLNR